MGNINKSFFLWIIVALGMVAWSALPAQEAKRSITKVSGDLYRFQNNFHYSVFLVTSDGIIATDPINAEAAGWLKKELSDRFNQPVKYLIYSHDHVDHIAGGEVFEDTAIVIAHENAKADIVAESRPTAVPDVTFSDQMTVELGGQSVELTYVGRGHSDNMVVMNFPKERVLFAVDFIPIQTVAWKNLTDAYVPDWMDAIKVVEGMDFDTLMPGHGNPGTKDDVRAFRSYMDDLYQEVQAAHRDGKSLREMQKNIRLDEYKSWVRYDKHLPLNIEGMYNQIQLHRRGN